MSTALLFDLDDVAPPTPKPAPAPTRPARQPARPVQMALDMKVHLTVHPDMHAATGGVCLVQQDECEEADCRHHLGAVRTHQGERYGCALAVADAYPHGLAPSAVAALLGVDEGTAQEAEHNAYRWCRQEIARQTADEERDARRARIRARLARLGE